MKINFSPQFQRDIQPTGLSGTESAATLPINSQAPQVDPVVKKPNKGLLENMFFPFGRLDNKTKAILFTAQLVLIFGLLEFYGNLTLPKPSAIVGQMIEFLQSSDFWSNLISTMLFICKGLLYAVFFTMIFSCLWTIEFFKPYINFIIKARYLPFNCYIFVITSIVSSTEELKFVLLMFGIIPYFTTSFVDLIIKVRDDGTQLNKARVNKMNEWQTLYEVIIVGKLDMIFEVIRANFAFAWTMITAIEAYAIAQGGLGTLLVKDQHHRKLEEIFAIAIIILLIGIAWDFLLRFLRSWFFAYVKTSK